MSMSGVIKMINNNLRNFNNRHRRPPKSSKQFATFLIAIISAILFCGFVIISHIVYSITYITQTISPHWWILFILLGVATVLALFCIGSVKRKLNHNKFALTREILKRIRQQENESGEFL